jgi:hypothetical protein
MCNFWSCIVDFDGNVYHNAMSDSHSDIALPENITDNTADIKEMQFAKVEIMPPDGDVFSDPKKWELIIDEERRPEWWSKFHEKQCRSELKKFLKPAILIGKTIDKIETGRFWLRDCRVDLVCGNAMIVQLFGTSQVGEMRETSQVGEMRETSQVGEMRGTSRVGMMWGTSRVGMMRETSRVGVMRETSRVGVMRETSQVGVMWETSQVGVMWGTSRVGEMWGTSRVGEMWGTSRVGVMRETSQVGVMWGTSQVGEMWGTSQVGVMWENAIAIIPGDKYKIIVADNDRFIIEKHIKK